MIYQLRRDHKNFPETFEVYIPIVPEPLKHSVSPWRGFCKKETSISLTEIKKTVASNLTACTGTPGSDTNLRNSRAQCDSTVLVPHPFLLTLV